MWANIPRWPDILGRNAKAIEPIKIWIFMRVMNIYIPNTTASRELSEHEIKLDSLHMRWKFKFKNWILHAPRNFRHSWNIIGCSLYLKFINSALKDHLSYALITSCHSSNCLERTVFARAPCESNFLRISRDDEKLPERLWKIELTKLSGGEGEAQEWIPTYLLSITGELFNKLRIHFEDH